MWIAGFPNYQNKIIDNAKTTVISDIPNSISERGLIPQSHVLSFTGSTSSFMYCPLMFREMSICSCLMVTFFRVFYSFIKTYLLTCLILTYTLANWYLQYLEMEIKNWPSGARQGQIGPIGRTGPNEAKRGQMGSNGPNRAKKWGS